MEAEARGEMRDGFVIKILLKKKVSERKAVAKKCVTVTFNTCSLVLA